MRRDARKGPTPQEGHDVDDASGLGAGPRGIGERSGPTMSRRSGERRDGSARWGREVESGGSDPAPDEDAVEDDPPSEATSGDEGERRSRRGSRPGDGRGVAALELVDVVKSYGEVVALECDHLRIEPGESVVLVGHNGSGKSTLLGLVAGTIDPTEGEVTVHGDDPGSLLARAQRSWLPDAPVLYDDLSVREHLAYTRRLHGGTGEEDLLLALVDRLGLSERVDDLPVGFSRGLRQKTAAAVALCRPFSVLLVDEPFVGLDTAGRVALLELIEESRGAGATVVVATHDPEVIDRFDRGIVLENGSVLHDGPASGLHDVLAADVRQQGAS